MTRRGNFLRTGMIRTRGPSLGIVAAVTEAGDDWLRYLASAHPDGSPHRTAALLTHYHERGTENWWTEEMDQFNAEMHWKRGVPWGANDV